MTATTLSPSVHGTRVDSDAPLVRFRNVAKRYPSASGDFAALSQLSLDITAGEFVAVVGESGSGKSTLLGLAAGIDRPSDGEVTIAGTAVHALDESGLTRWRGRTVGIVFQFFQLLPTLTVLENVMLPMDFMARWPGRERQERAMTLLESLGIGDQADKLPSRLSGGQQQRVAIARALANDPPLLLADEPTGNLDARSSAAMLDVFAGLVRDGRTLVLVTHAMSALRYASRAVALADGRVVADIDRPTDHAVSNALASALTSATDGHHAHG